MMQPYKRLILSLTLVTASSSTHAQMTQSQLKQLELDMNRKISAIATSNQPIYSAEKISQLQNKFTKNPVQSAHFVGIKQHCVAEISKYCPSNIIDLKQTTQCLAANQNELSSQCKSTLSNRIKGTKLMTDLSFHGINIPQGSQFFYYPDLRVTGVTLASDTYVKILNNQRQTQHIQVTNEITWYQGWLLRSVIPSSTNTELRFPN